MNNAPIGIYDSGLGGLTVWREVRKLLPEESLSYLGDGKNCPYGSRSRGEVQALADAAVGRLCEHVLFAAVCNDLLDLADVRIVGVVTFEFRYYLLERPARAHHIERRRCLYPQFGKFETEIKVFVPLQFHRSMVICLIRLVIVLIRHSVVPVSFLPVVRFVIEQSVVAENDPDVSSRFENGRDLVALARRKPCKSQSQHAKYQHKQQYRRQYSRTFHCFSAFAVSPFERYRP